MSVVTAVLVSVFPVLMLVAAFKDATTMTIPNWLCGSLALAFLPAAFAIGLPIQAVGLNLGIGFAGLLLGMGMFAAGWIGGGDAKLFAVGALWLGWPDTGAFLLWTALAGGALTLGLLSARKVAPFLPVRGPAWTTTLLEPRGDIPYGVAIATGGLAAFAGSAFARGFPLAA